MASKADFTEEEWKTLQQGLAGAGLYVALVDRGFFDSFKEATPSPITCVTRTSTTTAC